MPQELQTLLQPTLLFFLLGTAAGFLKSDLEVPKSISRYLSIYLMMSIGLRGGAHFADHRQGAFQLVLLALLMSVLSCLLAYILLKKLWPKIDKATRCCMSAGFGSISIVTFATACEWLNIQNIPYQSVIVAGAAIMEVPAILIGLLLAKKRLENDVSFTSILKEISINGSILLLTGSFLIGAITPTKNLIPLMGFFQQPFQGFLAFFMLDMGLAAARQSHYLSTLGLRYLTIGFIVPLLSALLATLLCVLFALDIGTGFLMITLAASASYIAVPAAMQHLLPEAQTGYYISMAIGVTFPFNILLGLPFYLFLAKSCLNS